MKVCTDACILGAYADVAAENEQASIRLLDIGTGTGLLALMAAQRNTNALIDAVEIDGAAAQQAIENVVASPFGERITLYQTSIQAFVPEKTKAKALSDLKSESYITPDCKSATPYHRILTNPPFYTNHLRSPDATVNRALHTDDLPFSELIAAVDRLLKTDGQWWVLLPPYEMSVLIKQAALVNIQPFRQLQVQHHSGKPVFRHITGFSYQNNSLTTQTLLIYEPDGRTYTSAFRSLLKDFYLIF